MDSMVEDEFDDSSWPHHLEIELESAIMYMVIIKMDKIKGID